MALSVADAQTVLKEAFGKRYVGHLNSCQRMGLGRACSVWKLSPAENIQVSADGFAFAAPYTSRPFGARHPTQNDGRFGINFKRDVNYVQVFKLGTGDPRASYEPKVVYSVGYVPAPERAALPMMMFAWEDETAARSFADAFNRLVYAANHDENYPAFVAAAKTWRESPTKPPLNPEAERLRVAAEKALDDQNINAAVENYEAGVKIQPMWPEGWYSLALLYGEQSNYAGASDCMKHYLELVPDASDAKEAREKMAGWEAKRRQ
jgi:tetratricopeptide (TPR) repeat protein